MVTKKDDLRAEEVLKDEEFIQDMKHFLNGVKKHGMPAVIKAITYLDFRQHGDETSKIISTVCEHVERATGRNKDLLKKELKTLKKGEYTTARNLCVLFLDKYGDLNYTQISTFLSRSRRDYACNIKRAFRSFHSDKVADIKLVGSLNPKVFIEVYNKIDKELSEHFKQNS